ncbi:MAG: methylated-DNA--[protein]-cysteine S-methyltransferase [Deltaproteobacteria bacterium]|nr:methylated-DNA--[protein]-cysteine S-methyltransferase [Deltaproteobacteria bacterium]
MKRHTQNQNTIECSVHSVLGAFHISATPLGLRSLRFPEQAEAHHVIEAETILPRQHHDPHPHQQEKWLHMTRQWLTAYLSGQPLPLLPPIDMAWCTPFGNQVYQQLMMVPSGHTVTYGELAFQLARPNSARAIGSWMAKNQIPIIIPCHRVLPKSGALGGWSGPRGMKKWLLNHERNASFTSLP